MELNTIFFWKVVFGMEYWYDIYIEFIQHHFYVKRVNSRIRFHKNCENIFVTAVLKQFDK